MGAAENFPGSYHMQSKSKQVTQLYITLLMRYLKKLCNPGHQRSIRNLCVCFEGRGQSVGEVVCLSVILSVGEVVCLSVILSMGKVVCLSVILSVGEVLVFLLFCLWVK